MSHHGKQHYVNTASGPLPIIPRRTSAARPTLPQSTKRCSSKTTTCIQRTRSAPSSGGSDNGSAHSSPSTPTITSIRMRRARESSPARPLPARTMPFASSPPSAVDASFFSGLRTSRTEENITLSEKRGLAKPPLIYVPGMSLRAALDRPETIEVSKTARPRAADDHRLVRKKSGQVVKSSLRVSRSAGDACGRFTSSKSEPATPVCKAVHFDAQLEHVKLFLAEQKPLAVSRNGSPTDDTSGTDSDFPSFIFGPESHDRRRRRLAIDVVNMPPRINASSNVRLEGLSIAADNASILGRVLVKNIAFAKTVVVRFTFDAWQTTSEVTGRYTESLSPEVDRFAFTIKLADLLARIEEKTLIFAVRYSVAGQEFWDNNGTLNYVAKFLKSSLPSPKGNGRSLSDKEASKTGNLASLQNKLEKVVSDEKERTVQNARAPVEAESEAPAFKSTSSLAERYDLEASLKNPVPWKYQEDLPSHQRTSTFPQFPIPTTSTASSGPMSPSTPQTTTFMPPLGSPRDGAASESPVSAPATAPPTRSQSQPRNHRRSHFDMTSFSARFVKLTPPTSPRLSERVSSMDSLDLNINLDLAALPKLDAPFCLASDPPASAPAALSGRAVILPMPPKMQQAAATTSSLLAPYPLFASSHDAGFDSEASTPQLVTPSSSRDTTPSPTGGRFVELPFDMGDLARSPQTHYSALINQYCFFTGSGAMMTRTSSAPMSENADGKPHFEVVPAQRSSSADDIYELRRAAASPLSDAPDVPTPPASLLGRSNSVFAMTDSSRTSTPVPFM